MRKLKHLPLELWPATDHEAFRVAYEPGDVFDESCGLGAHHSQGWRTMVQTSYRRWLGFLDEHYPDCPSSKYLRLVSVFNKRDSGSSLVSI